MSPYSYSPLRLMKEYEAMKSQESSLMEEPTTGEAGVANAAIASDKYNDSFVVAAVQLSATGLNDHSIKGFWDRAVRAIHDAATIKGANLILLPELFLGPYFCQSQEAALMGLAMEADDCFIVKNMQILASKYNVVLPISIFERKNNTLYNSIVMIDADGTVLGTYRKSHIPDGTGYQEKFYFSPGDTGFRVWKTKVGNVGVAICWDQWFPEAARAMALQGADILLYPTAIGSEPQDSSINSSDHWQRVMQGHAAANMIPVVASNRIGTEILLHEGGSEKQRIAFYGRSFITNEEGEIKEEVTDEDSIAPISIISTKVTPTANRSTRLAWGLFRDRRPELYGILQTKDGVA